MHPWGTKFVLLNYHHESACSVCRRDEMVIIRMRIVLLLHTTYASQTSVNLPNQLISFSCNAGMWMDVFGIQYSHFLPPPTSDDASRRGYVRREETAMPRTLHSENIFPCTKYTVAHVNSVFWRVYITARVL